MIALLLLLAPVQDAEEESDCLEWARAIDEADLSWWPDDDIGFELSGFLVNEFHAFGDEAPGLTVEDPSYRLSKHHLHHRAGDENEADSPEYLFRMDMFLDVFAGEFVSAFAHARVDKGPVATDDPSWAARLEQGFLQVGIPEISGRGGKFAAPIGNFMPRHDSKRNPFVTFPLPYDHIVTVEHPQDTATVILRRRDRVDQKDWRTLIWREMYGHGVMLAGSGDEWEYAAAMMTIAPASWPWEWERDPFDFTDPNFMGRVGYKPDITTTVGASFSHGAYQKDVPGFDGSDTPQTLAGLDFAWADGDWEVWAEGMWNRFETTTAGNLGAWTYYIEAKYQIEPGLFVAGRFAQMFFDEIRNPAGGHADWDRDVTRLEFGAGYFFTRNFWIKGTIGDTRNHQGREPDDYLFSIQLGLGF